MSLFRLDASIREDGSTSRALADLVEKHWQDTAPGAPVSRRHIGVNPLPSDAWATALAAGATPDSDRTDQQRQALTLAGTLTDELDHADAYLFAVPLYNFGPSQHFKTYVDLVTTDPRMAPGTATVTAGKPGVLVTVQGGNYSPGSPKEGWDHATDWMRRILEDVWHIDLRIVSREFTLVGVNPALDAFADMADQIKASAEHRAREHGQSLTTQNRAA
ncbi:NAD(P)H-dependent oxidoreductase [Conyzicola nivalis]|uniref:FMN-dependent NADH-azoreductase n=1 Tax=Conyzicola nivalis TaxID=1477021 RepID=A0A916WJ90_9MICO|nr:NAD(P)H-dependent oxidoreductase [Conyzicola nivalis]GGB02576.1 FMN-dependent NADH-azoreductase [Conyzicola nivalis]